MTQKYGTELCVKIRPNNLNSANTWESMLRRVIQNRMILGSSSRRYHHACPHRSALGSRPSAEGGMPPLVGRLHVSASGGVDHRGGSPEPPGSVPGGSGV